MPDIAQTILAAMGVLLLKHYVADFVLQYPYQFKNKGRYLHPGGILHSLIHIMLTIPVFAVLAPESWQAAAAILAGEFLIHYHVDWTKEQVIRRTGWTSAMPGFWRALGADQLAHGLTYVAILWALLTPGLVDRASTWLAQLTQG